MAVARWTIGNASQAGHEALCLSISSFRHLYPDTKIVICHNCPRNNLEYTLRKNLEMNFKIFAAHYQVAA